MSGHAPTPASPAQVPPARLPPARVLVVRPRQTGTDHGGDEVVYRRSIAALREVAAVEVVEIDDLGRSRKWWNVARGAPPELGRFIGAANVAKVRAALGGSAFDAAFFFHEATFPCRTAARGLPIRVVLAAHNVHSNVARREPTLVGRLFLRSAVRFERRWYADAQADLVCISNSDVAALRRAGALPPRVHVAPPGAPPASALDADAALRPEAVLTGSYAWWRKRRDLRAFARGPAIGVPVAASDPVALAVLGRAASPLALRDEDWSSAIRIGLVTDRFVGGFKLKATEYVARNCILLSWADLSEEFEGLPHAAEFVRYARGNAEAAAIVDGLLRDDPAAQAARFRLFRDACLERYRWDRCLEPLRLLAGARA